MTQFNTKSQIREIFLIRNRFLELITDSITERDTEASIKEDLNKGEMRRLLYTYNPKGIGDKLRTGTFQVNEITRHPSPINWEEGELNYPLGQTTWILNSLTGEFTLRTTFQTAEGEYASWNGIQYGIESAVLLESITSICDRAFPGSSG